MYIAKQPHTYYILYNIYVPHWQQQQNGTPRLSSSLLPLKILLNENFPAVAATAAASAHVHVPCNLEITFH